MNDPVPDELPPDFNGWDEDLLPDELPADFAGFDEELPGELPADFAGFDEARSPDPAAPKKRSPSTVPPASFGSSPLLEPLPPEARDQVMAFAQILGATVTHVIPRGMPDPVFPRDAPHDWDTWRRERDDRIFARAREAAREISAHKSIYEREQEAKEEVKREHERRKDWLDRQRQIGRGWAKYVYWLECAPEEAQAYRREHEDEQGEWLIEMAVNRKFKRRFQWMEARLRQSGRSAEQTPMEELESLWQQAKREEGKR